MLITRMGVAISALRFRQKHFSLEILHEQACSLYPELGRFLYTNRLDQTAQNQAATLLKCLCLEKLEIWR